jgi:hypothetical protein
MGGERQRSGEQVVGVVVGRGIVGKGGQLLEVGGGILGGWH